VKDRTLFPRRLCGAAVVAALLSVLAGCAAPGGAPAGAAPAPPTAAAAATATAAASAGESPTFTVSGAVARRATFDLAALKALPPLTQTVGSNTYTGVSLWTLLNDSAVGLKPDTSLHNPLLSMYALVTGTDGYRAVVALGEIAPEFGNRPAIVAYSVNGAPLGRSGMARLVVTGDSKPGRSVARLAAIEVFAAKPGR
jgi:DMSO/TMAO reductase YedYZ molybdopterin-dependent catalytic subunit